MGEVLDIEYEEDCIKAYTRIPPHEKERLEKELGDKTIRKERDR